MEKTINNTIYINCYQKNDPVILNENYFLEGNKYSKCNDSCKTCINNISCIECAEGYYPILDQYNNPEEDHCYKISPKGYYLKTNGKIGYKKCFETCSACFGEGNEKENKCINCTENYIKYGYDSTRCTNKTIPGYFWKINPDNKNVEILNDCNNYLICEGINSYRCVENCQSFINLNGIKPDENFTSLLKYTSKVNGKEQKYCLTREFCHNHLMEINYEKQTCNSNREVFISMCNISQIIIPSTLITIDSTPIIPTTILMTTNIIQTENLITEIPKPEPIPHKEIIYDRVIAIKNYNFGKINNSQIENNFSEIQITNYFNKLNSELNSFEYLGGIDFITVNRYENFTLIIYPLSTEEYLYNNILKTNNFCFINFTEFFDKINLYEQNKIIVGLIEFKNENMPINSINYFFYEYNETNLDYELINKSELINNFSSFSLLNLKTEYPLYNYNNPNINARYSLNLIETINKLDIFNSQIDFFNKTSDFYSNICRLFTSEQGTDMTINDRINNYYPKISLCENGCEFINLTNQEKNNNPRAVCDCKLKSNLGYSEDSYIFNYEKIKEKNVSNLNALKCIKTALSRKEIINNFVFWIFIFCITILFIIFLFIIFCSKSSIENILKIKIEINNEESRSRNEKRKISRKNSSIYSENDSQSKNDKSSSKSREKFNISGKSSSKISYSSPPKKSKDKLSTKGEIQIAEKSDNNSINTNINFSNILDKKLKNEKDDYDDIFLDKEGILNNNYYDNKYMKNNYIINKMSYLNIKKYFSFPPTKYEHQRPCKTDDNNYFDNFDSLKNINKKSNFHYYKSLLPWLNISVYTIDYNNINYPEYRTENDYINKKYIPKKSINLLEESNVIGDGQIFLEEEEMNNKNSSVKNKNKIKLGIKNSNDINLNEIENNNNKLFIHKKDKSLISSNSSIYKKSKKSKSGNIQLDKYFFNTSNNSIKYNIKYSFYYFYWFYLNRREFNLYSIYNLEDNIPLFIRISSFIFVILILFAINNLFLTAKQIHERYIYIKNHEQINEFSYIFNNEIGSCFLCSFIFIIIKLIFIKIIYGIIFKISSIEKRELSPFMINDNEKEEYNNKILKMNLYLKKYKKKSLIYLIKIIIISFFFGYISICYFGVFKNTKIDMILRFIISYIFSIIISVILCLIVMIIYHFGTKYDNIHLKKLYNIAKIIY